MPHRTARTGRILVVDDQSANVRVVTALLERHGYVRADSWLDQYKRILKLFEQELK